MTICIYLMALAACLVVLKEPSDGFLDGYMDEKKEELASASKHTVTANNNIGYRYVPTSNGVNSKSGRYLRSLSLLAVFLNWPSERLVSKLYSPSKPTAPTMASATSLMETSSFSPT